MGAVLVLAALSLSLAHAQDVEQRYEYIVDTAVGSDPDPEDKEWAARVSLKTASGIAFDRSGALFVVDSAGSLIWRASPDGRMTVVAGTGEPGSAGDGGPAVEAQLYSPRDIAFGQNGELYVSDNGRIRVISADGTISSMDLQPASVGEDGEEHENSEKLGNPDMLTYDPESRRLYVADTFEVFYIDDSARLHRFAGTGERGSEGEGGPAVDAKLFWASDMVVAADGSVYISQRQPARIWKVDSEGIITIAFRGDETFFVDEFGEVRWIKSVVGLAFDGLGRLVFTDQLGGHVYAIEQDGALTAMTLTVEGQSQGPMYYPTSLALTPSDEIYVSHLSLGVVSKLRQGAPNEIAVGSLNLQGDDGPATKARLYHPTDLTFDEAGNLYIADRDNAAVRRVTPRGRIERYAGNGGRFADASFEGRSAPDVALGFVFAVAATPEGLYALGNYKLRIVRPDRSVEDAFQLVGKDGFLVKLQGVYPDSTGGLFIWSTKSRKIWRFDTKRVTLTAVVGSGALGHAADSVQALETPLLAPIDMALDPDGNLYFIDGARYIHMVTPEGLLRTIAANPKAFEASGQAAPANYLKVRAPRALEWGPDNALYVSDRASIRRIYWREDSESPAMETIAGDGTAGFEGDGGPARAARFDWPSGMAFDANGRLYVADRNNHRVRVLTPVPQDR